MNYDFIIGHCKMFWVIPVSELVISTCFEQFRFRKMTKHRETSFSSFGIAFAGVFFPIPVSELLNADVFCSIPVSELLISRCFGQFRFRNAQKHVVAGEGKLFQDNPFFVFHPRNKIGDALKRRLERHAARSHIAVLKKIDIVNVRAARHRKTVLLGVEGCQLVLAFLVSAVVDFNAVNVAGVKVNGGDVRAKAERVRLNHESADAVDCLKKFFVPHCLDFGMR